VEGSHDHHGDSGHSHDHEEGNDPHIWLDPDLVKVQARTIADALIRVDPEGQEYYEKNYEQFRSDLNTLDEKLERALKPVNGKTFLVFHPAWGYFADAYGLKQVAVELEGKEPSARHMAKLIDRAESENVKVIFVQPQFSQSEAETIAKAIGGVVIPIDPLAEDYIENMEKVARKVAGALETRRGKQNEGDK
jgi:zinc transport system substrate-binding protein